MLLEKAQEKLLKKNHLETAMDSVGLKHVTRDTVDDLCKKITASWPRTRREIKPSQTSAKRLQTADALDTQEKKKSKAGGAVADAPLNAVGLEQSDREATGAAAQDLPHLSAGEGDGAVAASASVFASDERVLGAGTSASGNELGADGVFSTRGVLPSKTGVKQALEAQADAPTTQEQKRSNTSGAVGDAPSNAVGLEQSDSESTGAAAQVLPQVSAAGRDGAAAASASASASEEAGSGAGTTSSGAAARGEGVFSSQLLADVLCAALPTKVAMRDFVQAVKVKNEAFKSVQLSSKADGAYSNTQIAERIAECKPDQVTDAEGLLSWLIKVRAVVACA